MFQNHISYTRSMIDISFKPSERKCNARKIQPRPNQLVDNIGVTIPKSPNGSGSFKKTVAGVPGIRVTLSQYQFN